VGDIVTDIRMADPENQSVDDDDLSRVSGELVLNDVSKEIHSLHEVILGAASSRGFDEPSSFAIRLALEEAVANAFRHGNGSDVSKCVRVQYEIDAKRIWIAVEDEGGGFDPDAVPDPTMDENLEIPSGRGIMLMRAYMTHVEIKPPGNRIEMIYTCD
jgi:serine/threonine-protein kinase RsbW